VKYTNKREKIIFTAAIIFYFVFVVLFGFFSYQTRMKDALCQFGDKAMLLAIKFADDLNMDEKEYQRLLSLDFTELLEDEANKSFEEAARNVMRHSEIKYIYMFSLLPDDKLKYRVEEGEEDIYEMPVNTPLNLVYVLDAVKSDEIRMDDTDGNWYVDKDRYNVVNMDYSNIFNGKKASYLIVDDRWGSYVTGYAPVSSKQGNLIGYMGVDLFQTKYLETIKNDNIILTGFLLSIFTILIFLTYLYFKYTNMEKIACEKSYFSDYDLLTSVYSRRRIFKILHKEWEKCKSDNSKLYILFLDLDNFKEYNDQCGHCEGDNLLCNIALVIKENIEKYGGSVGRFGGDEFIAVLSNKSKNAVEKICMKINSEIKNIKNSKITISIGIKEVNFDIDSINSAIINADNALYRAKKNGKDTYYYMFIE